MKPNPQHDEAKKVARSIIKHILKRNGFTIKGKLAMRRLVGVEHYVAFGQSWTSRIDLDPYVCLSLKERPPDGHAQPCIVPGGPLGQGPEYLALRDALRPSIDMPPEEREKRLRLYYAGYVSTWLAHFDTVLKIKLILEGRYPADVPFHAYRITYDWLDVKYPG